MAVDMDISMDIQAKSVDMDMDMDWKLYIHGNPAKMVEPIEVPFDVETLNVVLIGSRFSYGGQGGEMLPAPLSWSPLNPGFHTARQ